MEDLYGEDGKNLLKVQQERLRKFKNVFHKFEKNFNEIFEKFFEYFWFKKVL